MADWAQARSIKGLFAASATATPAAAKPADQPARSRPAAEEDDDDRPSRARRRDEDDEDDDRPRKRRDDDEDDDRPSRSVRRRDEDDDDDDRPVRRRDDDEDDDDDRPRRRRRGRVPEDTANKKMVAGLLGILLGAWGIHKFYLGMTGAGVIQIVITILTCGVGGIIGLIEGIIYLTKSDEDFHQTYVIEQKGWF
jgi:TM2 domain-containing membrane protein YozV